MPIGVNLTSKPVTECGLTIKLRSPLAPLKKLCLTHIFLNKIRLDIWGGMGRN